ncbi:MAG: hypothetical protein M1819_001280 [Sarea resinae]|nr:MAG: hypothetical protein M1819_001280 [Sarea resinae]
MLVRAARRKVQYDAFRHLRPSADQLYLPWLCPAQLRYQSQARAPATELRRDKAIRRPSMGGSSRRSLATAAAEREPYQEYVPFEGLAAVQGPPSSQPQSWYGPRSITEIQAFDPSNPLIVQQSSEESTRRFQTSDGFGGELGEMHVTLEACLKIGRLERAAALVRRLNKIYALDAPQLVDAHNLYLRSVVGLAITARDPEALKSAQKWFEVEIRGGGIEPDATTYALMVKGALRVLQGPKMERTVRRYMDMASRAERDVEVLNLPILADAELYNVLRICPTEYYPAEEEIEETADTSSLLYPQETGDVPEVRAMQQKGSGLKTLKRSLSLFSKENDLPYPTELEGTQEERDRAYAYMRQEHLEEDAVTAAIDRWRDDAKKLADYGVHSALQTKSVGALMWDWHSALLKDMEEELRLIEKAEEMESKSRSAADVDRCTYGPFLRLLTPEKLVATTVLSSMSLISLRGVGLGVKVSQMIMHVGKAIQDEVIAESIKNDSENVIWGNQSSASRQQSRQQTLSKLMKKKRTFDSLYKLTSAKHHGEQMHWPTTMRAKIGAIMVSNLIQAAKVNVRRKHPETGKTVVQVQPAFSHSYRYDSGKRVGVILGNTAVLEKLKKEPVSSALAKHLPMVIEPKPWTGISEGGFLRYPAMVVRLKSMESEQAHYMRAATEKGDMQQVYSGLDVLGRTSWKINRPVFDAMLEAWNSGEAIADIAPETPALESPPEPEPSADPRVRQRWMKHVRMVENEKGGLHSQRCFQNFQLEVARAYLKEQKFYFPHNVDFRGRAYPIPPYLNHMGADNCRGLLMFGDGKELGPNGLRWLKVHLANVFGFDKASIIERRDFAMEHLSDIYDSASNPLGGKRWWLKAEDPWQCLAACMELKNALDSPDPTRFVSHLPIHQDGTCNGLQHYAALGGDEWGARQVNLEPGDRPADIYTAVSELVKKEISEDAAKGDKLGIMLDGKVSRKVVKQTVMTNVYGVTFIGARDQVRKQLADLFPEFPDTDEMNLGVASSYIAKKIFKALSTSFKGAHDIQYWLGECANRVTKALSPEQLDGIENGQSQEPSVLHARYRAKPSKSKQAKAGLIEFKSSVVWTTPLKLPVVQPYRTRKARLIQTNLQKVSIVEPSSADPVSRRKQLQGFPPNFIHSLDASHMLLSALKCDELGLSFAAVHDSFWTHAADLDVMNEVLRDAFIRMHSDDIVGRLAAEFEARYKGFVYLASISSESPAAKKIMLLRRQQPESGRNVLSNVNELLTERERQRLLASEDVEEQQKGREMVTPASIFEAEASELDLLPSEESADSGIGDVPKRETKILSDDDAHVEDARRVDTVGAVLGGVDPTALDASDFAADAAADGAEARPLTATAQKKSRSSSAKGQGKGSNKVQLWLPLSFPPVPEKGSWDISRLKESKYFFS